MTEEDEAFLAHVKEEFLTNLRERIRKCQETNEIPAPVRSHAGRVKDGVVREFLLESQDPQLLLMKLKSIEALALQGEFLEAWREYSRLKRTGDHAWSLSTQKPLLAGYRFLVHVDDAAAMKKGKASPEIAKVLRAMEANLAAGKSIADAASLAFEKTKVGTSQSANERAWYRHKKKQ